ncbi:hypothetical protein [Faecalibacillus faecis]|uniref:hypothetical protein n=1 Tax=Faecalibacillus faecis TaxID=1982628 RepID=UPI003870E4EA
MNKEDNKLLVIIGFLLLASANIAENIIAKTAINYISLVLSIVAGIFFILCLIKTKIKTKK